MVKEDTEHILLQMNPLEPLCHLQTLHAQKITTRFHQAADEMPSSGRKITQPTTDLHVFVNLIGESLKEIEGILLLPHIDGLAPQSEHTPESLWFMVLQLALHQVTKHLLHLVEHTDTRTPNE